MSYVPHGGLRVAKLLHDLVRNEIAPGTGIAPDAVWTLLDSIVGTLGPRNRALLEKRDALQAKIDAWLAARRGTAARAEGDRRVPTRDRLPRAGRSRVQGDHGQRRCRDRQLGRPAARGARRQSALRPERGQRALGQSLRRALWHQRDPRGRRRRERPRLQPRARRARHRQSERIPRSGRAADRGEMGRRRGARRKRRQPHVPLARRAQLCARRRRAVRRLPSHRQRTDPRLVAPSRAAHRDRHRCVASDRPAAPGGRQGRRARERDHDDHGLRRLRRGRRRRRQDRRVSQLVRHHARHVDGVGRQRRPARSNGASIPIANTRHRTARRSRCRAAACCSFVTSARTC